MSHALEKANLKLASSSSPETMNPIEQRYLNMSGKQTYVTGPNPNTIARSTDHVTSIETVSPGEVCSIEMAKKYGIYDAYKYYTDDYLDTKTYNPTIDEKSSRPNKLCKEINQNNTGSVAYPMCTLLYGINSDSMEIVAPYVQDKINANKCVIDSCPPSFIKKDGKCMKPNILNNTMVPVAKKTRCDEKKSDWYMFPNYHLGNKYSLISNENKETVCMKPCTMDKIPGYMEDPVNGSSAGVRANTILTKCYDKNEYMNGNYNNTGSYCPLSWIYRLGQTKDDIIEDLKKEITTIETENNTNDLLNRAKQIANDDAEHIDRDRKLSLENVTKPTPAMLAACRQLYTPDRIKKAYDICKDLKTNLDAFNNGLTDNQKSVLSQACHAQFCNQEDDDALTMISPSTEALCFDSKIKKIESTDILNNERNIAMQQSNEIEIGDEPTIKDTNYISNGLNLTKLSLYTSLFILIGLPIIILFVYATYKFLTWLWTNYISPYIGCRIVFVINRLFSGAKYAASKLSECQEKPQIQSS